MAFEPRGGAIPAVPDVRRARYTMRSAVESVPVRTVRHTPPPVKDQQGLGCVPWSWRTWMEGAPVADRASMTPDVVAMYALMQDKPGNQPPDFGAGCYVDRGPKVMQQLGRLGSYFWGATADECRDFLVAAGPFVLACPWYDSMSRPDGRGKVAVDPSSGLSVGWHQFFVFGYDVQTDEFECQNSWGTGFAAKGRFFVARSDVNVLFAAGASAVAGSELPNADAQAVPDPDVAPMPLPAPPARKTALQRLLAAIRRLFGR